MRGVSKHVLTVHPLQEDMNAFAFTIEKPLYAIQTDYLKFLRSATETDLTTIEECEGCGEFVQNNGE